MCNGLARLADKSMLALVTGIRQSENKIASTAVHIAGRGTKTLFNIEEVGLELMKISYLPILTNGLECYSMNKNDHTSLRSVIIRFVVKFHILE